MSFELRTREREELVDVTRQIDEIVRGAGIESGAVVAYCPHTTAGLTINENADPDVVMDMLDALERLVPKDPGYRHSEGNSDSHVKASLVGSSVTLLVEGGALVLGTWQGVYFCEFDGPRSRQVEVQVLHS